MLLYDLFVVFIVSWLPSLPKLIGDTHLLHYCVLDALDSVQHISRCLLTIN
jgi:hypothetical protein